MSPMPTPESIDATVARLREMEKAATSAPWTAPEGTGFDGRHSYIEIDTPHGIAARINDQARRPVSGIEMSLPREANAALIVEMRNSLPRLLDEIERLQRENAGLRELFGDVVVPLETLVGSDYDQPIADISPTLRRLLREAVSKCRTYAAIWAALNPPLSASGEPTR